MERYEVFHKVFHTVKVFNGGFFFFCKRCIMAYCTLISTEQIDKLKSSPQISYLMYFKIRSDQSKISRNTLQQKCLIYLPNHYQDLNKVLVFSSELLHCE